MHRRVIEADKGNARGIRTPPICLVIEEDLFGIDPVRLAVADQRRAVGGELAHGRRGGINDVKVLIEDEGHELSVRAERDELLLSRSLGQADGMRAVEVAIVQVVAMLDDRARLLRIHLQLLLHGSGAPPDGCRRAAGQCLGLLLVKSR